MTYCEIYETQKFIYFLSLFIAIMMVYLYSVKFPAREKDSCKHIEISRNPIESMCKDGLCEYDGEGNLIHYKNSTGFEKIWGYDKNGREIFSKDSNNITSWNKYDNEGKLILRKVLYGRVLLFAKDYTAE